MTAPAASQASDSWFGALGVSAEARWRDEAGIAASVEEAGRERRWFDNDQGPADRRLVSREARRIVAAHDSALRRIFSAYAAARAALGVALVAWLLVAGAFSGRVGVPALAICGGYATQALAFWLLPRWRPDASRRFRRGDWLQSVGVDLLAFAALHLLEPFSGLNYVALLVLPVLMAGVLTSRAGALATVAGVSLLLLASAWRAPPAGTALSVVLSQAGLTSVGFFIIVVLAGELAGRLAREERSARGSLELARQQARLNRLVIEEMADGVLVVDRRGRVRTANPAALRLLAGGGEIAAPPFLLAADAGRIALAAAVAEAFERQAWPRGGRDIAIRCADGASRTLRVRARFTRRVAAPAVVEESLCVLFAEDLRAVQDRSRDERLVAMGRVSVGVAHEIRNPLAAIAQASALMDEDAVDLAQKRLLAIVGANVERLKRIVDDVMAAAPGLVASPTSIDAVAEVASVCAEWARVAGLPAAGEGRLEIALPHEPLGVAFDAEHLRRVLVNLLDNALRHAGDAPGAVSVSLRAEGDAAARLVVASDGEPIAADVEPFLFEPFHSTRSRGTGLGLFICRQLCERHGARIDYERHPAGERHRNAFEVAMRRAEIVVGERMSA